MKTKKTRFLYIRLDVQDGEREHTHHVLHTTTAENLAFAAQRYASTFWGKGVSDRGVWWFDGEFTVKLDTYKELTQQQYDYLLDLMYT